MKVPLRLCLALLLATVGAFLLVPASQAAASEYHLTVNNNAGNGEGEVECEVEEPGGTLEPPSLCEGTYPQNTKIVVIPNPEAGSQFVEFKNATGSAAGCKGKKGTCTISKLTEDSTIEPEFNLITRTLDVKEVHEGGVEGEVDVECHGCEAVEERPLLPEGMEYVFPAGAEIIISRELPAEGAEFGGFKGTGPAATCAGATESCRFELTSNSTVTVTVEALFTPIHHMLTVRKAGTGSGAVISVAPKGAISCGSGCSARLEAEKQVTLVAIATPGSAFAGWSSGCEADGEECTVTLEADTTVTATFDKSTRPVEEEEPEEGSARAAGTAQVKAGRAALKLSCTGGPCKGALKLTAKVKQGGKVKSLTIGGASFSLSKGSSKTLQVKLSGPAKQELAKGRALKAKLTGTGIAGSTVTLKPAKK